MKTVYNGAGVDNTANAKLWLLQNRNLYVQDLFQIGPYFPATAPLPGGAWLPAPLQYFWTDADYPIKSTYLGQTYFPQRIKRGTLKYEIGTKPSEYTFYVYTQDTQQPLKSGDSYPRGQPPYQDAIMTAKDSFGGWTMVETLKQAFVDGDLDGVPFSIWRAIMPTPGDADTIGVARVFFGYISKVEAARSYVKVTAASIMQIFQSQIPTQLIEPGDRGGSFIPAATYDYGAQVEGTSTQDYIDASFVSGPAGNYVGNGSDFDDGWLIHAYDAYYYDVAPWMASRWPVYRVRRIRQGVLPATPTYNVLRLYLYERLPLLPWRFSIEHDNVYLFKKTSLDNVNSKAPGFPYVPIPETAV